MTMTPRPAFRVNSNVEKRRMSKQPKAELCMSVPANLMEVKSRTTPPESGEGWNLVIFGESRRGACYYRLGKVFKGKAMNRRKGKAGWRVVTAALLCVGMAVTWGCRRKERREQPLDFVPSGADVIAELDYGKFMENEVFRRVFDDSELKRILQGIGLSAESVVRVAGYAKINPELLRPQQGKTEIESPGDFAVIVEGKEPLYPILKRLSENGWARKKHGAKRYWAAPEGEQPLAAASLRGNLLVAGTAQGVRDVLDVAAGKDEPAIMPASGSDSGAIIRQIGKSGAVCVAISFTKEMKMAAEEVARSAGIFGGITGGRMVGGVLEALGTGRGIGLSFESEDGGVASLVVFVAGDAAAAKVITGLLKFAKIAVPSMAEFGSSEAAAMIRGLNVWSQSNVVFIDFTVPESVFRGAPRQPHPESPFRGAPR